MQKDEELLISIRQVIRAIDLHSKRIAKDTGLTTPQLLVLKSIQAKGGIMVKDIASEINLSSATVTTILDRLEARGLVIRVRSTTDKRKVEINLSESGVEAISEAPKPLQSHFIDRFEKLEPWEQSQMVATMQRIASMMDAESIDASPMLEVGQIHKD
jgi:DNA-binding MarR family transcriptional regulator